MSSTIVPERTLEPREAEKKALLNLLSDEDGLVYQAIRTKILTYGFSATRWLQPSTLSSDPVLRRRTTEIIQYLSRQATDNRFLAFCLTHGEELDIEEGALLLAQTQYPEINTLAYQALFDSYAADLREQIDPGAPADQVIAAINQYLFEELGYHGNEEDYYNPENSYINRVVDKRAGNPISLCTLYLFVARRLQLPMVGIGMPGHFLCRFQTASEDVLFIDAFNRGKLLTKADCVKYLVNMRDGFKDSYLAPVTGRRTLLRMCSNLHQIYSQLSLADEMARCQRYIVALAK
ncbi:MAG TPA: transglutaminase-like domain-containing protein [Candidatus Kapabacteria bacterium]|nr:transglutaminase-like domain-containing protein [Candidatus Kapabacteria bacterium]